MNHHIQQIHTEAIPKFCKNCKYFKRPIIFSPLRYGDCTYFRSVNKVDGTIVYPLAVNVRQDYCKDVFYEEKVNPITKLWKLLIKNF